MTMKAKPRHDHSINADLETSEIPAVALSDNKMDEIAGGLELENTLISSVYIDPRDIIISSYKRH